MKTWAKRAKIAAQKDSADLFEAWKQAGGKILREGKMHRGAVETSFATWSLEYLILTGMASSHTLTLSRHA